MNNVQMRNAKNCLPAGFGISFFFCGMYSYDILLYSLRLGNLSLAK
jgi:hypothetical protein